MPARIVDSNVAAVSSRSCRRPLCASGDAELDELLCMMDSANSGSKHPSLAYSAVAQGLACPAALRAQRAARELQLARLGR